MQRVTSPALVIAVAFILATSLQLLSQEGYSKSATGAIASLHPQPQLIWQRISPTAAKPEGPVLYQIIFRSSATPLHVPAISQSFTLMDSPIVLNALGGVSIGGLMVAADGTLTFAASQTFPITGTNGGTVTQINLGPGLTGTNPITSAGTISLDTAFTDGRYLATSGGTIAGSLNIAGALNAGSLSGGTANLTGNMGVGGNITTVGLTASGPIAAPSFTGDGSAITNVNAASLAGQPITFFPQLVGGNNFKGDLTLGSNFSLLPNGQATGGSPSFPSGGLDLLASTFSATTGQSADQLFRWQTLGVGGGGANPTGQLNLLFQSGHQLCLPGGPPGGACTANPTPTGLFINSDGTIHFAPGQTFPGGSGTVTTLNAGSGITLNPNPITATGSVALDTAFTDSRYLQLTGGTMTGIVSFAAGQTFPGGTDAATLGGIPAADYARVDISNTFAADQNFSKNILLAPLSALVPVLPPSGTINAFSGIFVGNGGGVVAEDTEPQGIGVQGYATDVAGAGVFGNNPTTTGTTDGVMGFDHSPNGEGVRGVNFATTGGTGVIGVYGNNLNGTPNPAATGGNGVYGFNSANNGTGVLGQSAGTGGTGVMGRSTATTGFDFGVAGQVASTGGIGVDGFSSATTGTSIGTRGIVNSASGTGGLFENDGSGCNGSSACTILSMFANGTLKFHFDGAGNAHAAGAFQGGGADFAESVSIEGVRAQYEAGDVLVIDEQRNRQLKKAQSPYSTLVAGIVSTKPAFIGSLHDSNQAKGQEAMTKEVLLAVVGIVPCKVSTENGPIRRGDLLVSSSTPGFAMKGTDRSQMLGAVIGKAMQPLESGTGVVEVLVTLQ